jgi:UDP:flavonoid glycosyltransferase YjiC (YdhE family)
MRISVLAVGSQGDIQPYLALAVGLKKQGYDVRFVANLNFAGLASQYDLDFSPIQVDSLKIAETPQVQAWFESGSMLKLLLNTRRVLMPLVPQFLVDILKACHESDAIIYHSFALPFVYYVGRELNIPCIPASIDPLPTRAHPALALNVNWSRSRAFNMFTHWMVDHFAWQMFLPPLRKSWKGKLDVSAFNPHRQILTEQNPVLCAYSQTVVARPPDLPPHVVITGYWFLDPDSNFQPAPELVEFIHSGKRPIYVGFGSMGNPNDGDHTADMVLHALAETGQRAVLGAGWSRMGIGYQLPSNVFLLKSIPHTWLFPQMAAVVHHAGPGTTAAGLSAGVPNVAIPHFASQYFYADRIAKLGAGPEPIDRKKLTTKRLTQAISAATTNRSMQEKANAIGAHIRAEDGVRKAVEEIRCYIG